MKATFAALCFCLLPWIAAGQEEQKPGTRTEQLMQEPLVKSTRLTAPSPDRLEDDIEKLDRRVLQRLFAPPLGPGIRFGGLVTGSGFAIGPSYSRPDLLKENLRLKISAAGSLKLYYSVDALASFPRLLNHRLTVDIYGRHSDAPQIAYYGPGPDSSKDHRTNYRREDTIADGRAGFRVLRNVLVGFTTGVNFINVGPGTSDVYASTDQVFSPRQAPGIETQSRYYHFGPFVQFDTRDRKNDPHRGTNFVGRYAKVKDDLGIYRFQAAQGLIEQYVPFLNEKRVLALRARTDLTYPKQGNVVPFYLQPTLGGDDSLRGFRQWRFYDNNVFFLNAEYRWEVAPALDMAVFFDAGKVFPKPGDIGFSGLEKDGGFGFRFKTRGAVVFRVDTGFSREGFQIWFKFDPPFAGLFHGIF